MENEKIVSLIINGEPFGKQRPKATTFAGHARVYTPTKTANYESYIKFLYEDKYGRIMFEKNEPIYVTIGAYYSVPKSTSKKKANKMLDGEIKPTKKPDVDNIAKVVMDALNGLAYHDDAQVTLLTVNKGYHDEPFVAITIGSLEKNEGSAFNNANQTTEE